MKWPETLRQAHPGLPGLAAVSAIIIPLWIWIAAYHAEHWFGGQRADLWSVFVRPWGERIWGGLMVMAIVPWAARPRSGDARQLNPTLTSFRGATWDEYLRGDDNSSVGLARADRLCRTRRTPHHRRFGGVAARIDYSGYRTHAISTARACGEYARACRRNRLSLGSLGADGMTSKTDMQTAFKRIRARVLWSQGVLFALGSGVSTGLVIIFDSGLYATFSLVHSVVPLRDTALKQSANTTCRRALFG